MAYDEALAARLRDLLADGATITEKKMFGGLAFLVNGNMAVAAARNGGLLVRIDPVDADTVLQRPHAEPMEMRGRAMDGWITVAPPALTTNAELSEWVARGVAFTKSLPPK